MIDYEDNGLLLPLIFRRKGSVFFSASKHAIPSTLLTVFLLFLDEIDPEFKQDIKYYNLGKSQIWNMTIAVLMFLIGFRAKAALGRFWEGCGLLHQMKGEWFEACSNCIAFSSIAVKDKPTEVRLFRHTMIRLMSLCHACALEEVSGMSARNLDSIDLYGLSTHTLKYLKACNEKHVFNKVEVIIHLLQTLITRKHADGVIPAPAPVLTRAFQNISRGYVHFLNTKKITDVKFPFPYCQLIALLLALHMVLVPAMVTATLDSKVLAPIVSFLVIFGVSALNLISQELEMPFGLDANDLPIDDFQTEMNDSLLILLHPTSDLIAGMSRKAKMNFEELEQEARKRSGRESEHLTQRFDRARILERRPSIITAISISKDMEEHGADIDPMYGVADSDESSLSPTLSPAYSPGRSRIDSGESLRATTSDSFDFPWGTNISSLADRSPRLFLTESNASFASSLQAQSAAGRNGQFTPFTQHEQVDPKPWDVDLACHGNPARPKSLEALRLLPFGSKDQPGQARNRSLVEPIAELSNLLQRWTQTIAALADDSQNLLLTESDAPVVSSLQAQSSTGIKNQCATLAIHEQVDPKPYNVDFTADEKPAMPTSFETPHFLSNGFEERPGHATHQRLMEQVAELNSSLQRWRQIFESQMDDLSSHLVLTAERIHRSAHDFEHESAGASASWFSVVQGIKHI